MFRRRARHVLDPPHPKATPVPKWFVACIALGVSLIGGGALGMVADYRHTDDKIAELACTVVSRTPPGRSELVDDLAKKYHCPPYVAPTTSPTTVAPSFASSPAVAGPSAVAPAAPATKTVTVPGPTSTVMVPGPTATRVVTVTPPGVVCNLPLPLC